MKRTLEKREDLVDWLKHHPERGRGSAEGTLKTVEREVRNHAKEVAWQRAIAIAHARGEAWSQRSQGMHCPEDWAVREFCREFASDLKMFEPALEEGSEEEFAGKAYLAAFSPEGRDRILSWVHDLATEEEHDAWREVMRFTKNRADAWIRDGAISTEERWELTRSYAEAVMHATELLERDYERRAHTRV